MNDDFLDSVQLMLQNLKTPYKYYSNEPNHTIDFKVKYHKYNCSDGRFDEINKIYTKYVMKFYQTIEKDLEYIINSPSTIAGIFKYYHTDMHLKQGICVLYFGNIPVRVWQMSFDFPKEFKKLYDIK